MKKDKKQRVDHLANPFDDEILDIPEEEIWTYQIEGLAAPHINKPYKNFKAKKIVFACAIAVAVLLSMYFSIRAVQRDTFEFAVLDDGTYEFVKFSNTGYIPEISVDYVTEILYKEDVDDLNENFELVKDETKPVSVINEYAFNCDERLEFIRIGESVTEIDGKSFYTCKNLQAIFVDENNPNYCDVDGVLYNKNMTEIICYPMNRDQYLRDRYGYEEELWPWSESDEYDQYVKDVRTYVLPSTVEKVGKLCFNYTELVNVYLPEGVRTIETLGFFRATSLESIYSYKCDEVITDTAVSAVEKMTEIYPSLPEGLEYIGSDAFSYDQALSYMYIPSSVTYIGHHAFWETAYKSDGEILGVNVMNVALDEDSFSRVETGNQWRSQHDNGAFRKTVETVYSAQRESL